VTYKRRHSEKQRLHWLAALSLLVGLVGTIQAQTRFTYSTDGSEVSDAKTGLVWQRCTVGQSWSGSTCTGTPSQYSHEAALAYTKNQVGWRLPNVKELSSLLDRSVIGPSIDLVAFPATPARYGYWSASPLSPGTTGTNAAWSVDFSSGEVFYDNRTGIYLVRLVR
jgi:hypothetical protein